MTFYDDFGREVEPVSEVIKGGTLHTINDFANHGQQPDFTKESIIGEEIRVVGITGPEDMPLGPVYFILFYRAGQGNSVEPWGFMFPAKSPVVQLTLRAVRAKKLPFAGILDRTTSESNPQFQYWNWRR